MDATSRTLRDLAKSLIADPRNAEEVASRLVELAQPTDAAVEEERIAECDGLTSLALGDQDWDHDRWCESNGFSEYDLDPGVSCNDAGEPRGYM